MPDIGTSKQTVSPSIGGQSVKDVLQGIQVRDPRRKNITGHMRRQSDFETHWDIPTTLLMSAAVSLVVAGVLFIQFRIPPMEAPAPQMGVPTPAPAPSLPRMTPQTEAPLSIPENFYTSPQTVAPSEPQSRRPDVEAPVAVSINHLGPRTLEVRWEASNEGHTYLLYMANDRSFRDARLILDEPIPSTHGLWTPDENVNSAWIAVQALDAQGNPSDISRPVYVELPPV